MELKTVKQVCSYVKPIIDDYRKYQSHENKAVDALRAVFSSECDAWKIVIDGGSFVTTFKKDLGKNRLKYLQKLLYCIDLEWYKTIDFT